MRRKKLFMKRFYRLALTRQTVKTAIMLLLHCNLLPWALYTESA
jgi:hypothetical protein